MEDIIEFMEIRVGPDVTKYILELASARTGEIFRDKNGRFFVYNGRSWIDIGYC